MPYDTPQALRAALEDRLRNQSRQSAVDIERLRRRAVFERLLVRLQVGAPDRWVLKGGMALEFRVGDRARATRDLDLVVRDAEEAQEVRDLLIESLAADPDGDGFEFAVGQTSTLEADQAGRPGWRFTVDARLAARRFAIVRLDVVARRDEIGGTERVPLPGAMAFAGMPARDIEVVDRRQHFAEKLHALTRTYGDRPSSRVRDLLDLVLLIEGGLEADGELVARVNQVFGIRATHLLPDDIPNPPPDWTERYAVLASDLDIGAGSLETALLRLRDFWERALTTEQA